MAQDDSSQATLVLTKVAAAQRQLDAATRMFFAEEDELAIHTVAAAAYRVLHDLNKKRGRHLIPDQAFHYGMFHMARAFALGIEHELPEAIRAIAEDNDFIAGLSNLIRSHISKTGKVPEFEDFRIEVPHGEWEKVNQTANFLKHADRDFDKVLNFAYADDLNLKLLCNAQSAYIDLMHACTPEMRVFTAYISVLLQDQSGLDKSQMAIFEGLRKLDPNDRRRACLEVLAALKEPQVSENR